VKEEKEEVVSEFFVPAEVKIAVAIIENWANKQTPRDDWAIGGICCRRGAERLIKENKKLDKRVKILEAKVRKLKNHE
jgi:hypothetical protein